MGRRFPPFSAVRAFEAAARHGSFKGAAEELCLSPSAVSHQIRGLEDYLATKLFERKGNQMVLTLTGRSYAGKLTGLLNSLDETTRAITEAGERPFRIECTPGFAARWLVPRLGRLSFGNRVRLRLSVGAPNTDFASNDADMVIQWAEDPTPGVITERLMVSARYPVISPELMARELVSAPADLLRLTLMQDETDDGWAAWFAAAGVAAPAVLPGPVYPNCELATTAVEQGLGVSLAYDAVVRGTLASGRLVRLFETVTVPMVIYSLAYPETRAEDPMIRTFRTWIFDEIAQEQRDLSSIAAAE